MITVFVLLKTTKEWLRLERTERNRIADSVLSTVLSDKKVTLRMFDAEAFTTKCTDFEMVEIIPTIEDGFKAFEKESMSKP